MLLLQLLVSQAFPVTLLKRLDDLDIPWCDDDVAGMELLEEPNPLRLDWLLKQTWPRDTILYISLPVPSDAFDPPRNEDFRFAFPATLLKRLIVVF